MDFDLLDLFVGLLILLCILALAVAILWPLDRRDGVMLRVHGDQPELPQR